MYRIKLLFPPGKIVNLPSIVLKNFEQSTDVLFFLVIFFMSISLEDVFPKLLFIPEFELLKIVPFIKRHLGET